MQSLFAAAASGDPDALGGMAALVSMVALLPAAVPFIVNQIYQIRQLREEKHRYILELHQSFLDRCLLYPELRLEHRGEPPKSRLTASQRYQRDIMFDILTSIFERAYLAYANRLTSFRHAQWGGWDGYIDYYLSQSIYREWWLRVVFEGDTTILNLDLASAVKANHTQYDTRFERYMFRKLANHTWDLTSLDDRGRNRLSRVEPSVAPG